MYPVLKIMHMLNFLDTFSMSITLTMCFNNIIVEDRVVDMYVKWLKVLNLIFMEWFCELIWYSITYHVWIFSRECFKLTTL